MFHRKANAGVLSIAQAAELARRFLDHAQAVLWEFIPGRDDLLRRAGAASASSPVDLYLRSAEAIHLLSATELGETEIWTNDRRMLAAASHSGIHGRSAASPAR